MGQGPLRRQGACHRRGGSEFGAGEDDVRICPRFFLTEPMKNHSSVRFRKDLLIVYFRKTRSAPRRRRAPAETECCDRCRKRGAMEEIRRSDSFVGGRRV